MTTATEPRARGDDGRHANSPTGPGLAWLPLLTAIALTLGVTADPRLLTSADGHVDHVATLLAVWAMSAGFVRGTGFIPRHRALRLALSGPACLLALLLATARVFA